MTEQRLLEEILETVRVLRDNDTKTQVRLAQITEQLAQINGVRPQVEANERTVSDHGVRLKALEEMNIDARLRKVEGTTWKLTISGLALIGVLELLDKIMSLVQRVHP